MGFEQLVQLKSASAMPILLLSPLRHELTGETFDLVSEVMDSPITNELLCPNKTMKIFDLLSVQSMFEDLGGKEMKRRREIFHLTLCLIVFLLQLHGRHFFMNLVTLYFLYIGLDFQGC